MNRDPLIEAIARTLSDAGKLVFVLGLIPLAFVLAGPAAVEATNAVLTLTLEMLP